MARSLIENLTDRWNPEAFTDAYREAMLEIVEKKLAGEPIEAPTEEAPARVVDLMEALKASVAAAKDKTPSAGGAKRSGAEATGRQEDHGQARDRDEEGARRARRPPASERIGTGPRLAARLASSSPSGAP